MSAIARIRPFLASQDSQVARDRGRVGRAEQQRRAERADAVGVRRPAERSAPLDQISLLPPSRNSASRHCSR